MRVLLLLLCVPFVQAQKEIIYFPGMSHSPAVPHPKELLGFDFGDRITTHHEALTYARALAEHSPRVTLVLRDATWEGRPMAMLLIGTKAHILRLEQLREQWQALADPRTTSEGALAGMKQRLPALVWLQESVHGNEISGTDSGLLLAWHLASARSEEVDRLLENVVVGIELMQNPDGRDRFVHYTRMQRSPLGGDGYAHAAEHNPTWASGRHNHYMFDMNRDWFALTQPETRTKVATFLQWFPQIVVDLHEMRGDAHFFAANPSAPANPLLAPQMKTGYVAIGKAVGAAFDAAGIDYFHGEIFDSFYPGYGESWPSLQGATGILFEQASARGLNWHRKDGTTLTHRQAVWHQALASYTVLTYASNHRVGTLDAFYRRRAEALRINEGAHSVVLLPGEDPGRAVHLGRLLKAQGIEVHQLTKAARGLVLSANDKRSKQDLPVGTLVINLAQPSGRLARTLLLETIPLDAEFLSEEQQRWNRTRSGTRIYDVTGWSLPMLYGVPAYYSDDNLINKLTLGSELKAPTQLKAMDARRGYLIKGGINAYPMLASLLKEGFRVSFSARPIVHQGETFPPGSLIIRHADNPDGMPKRLEALAKQHEVFVLGTNTSWFDEGPGFGSGEVRAVKPPRIALAWEEPTEALSAGWMRFVLEQRFGYPVTAINSKRLARVPLHDFDVLLMPSGHGWDEALGEEGTDKLKAWIRDGGVLVSVGATTEWLADETLGLLATIRELRGGVLADDKKKDHPKRIEQDPSAMVEPRSEQPRPAYGALLRIKLDSSHWINAAMPEEAAAMVYSNRILRPLRLDEGTNPARYAAREELLLSGHVPVETLEQFAHKPFLMVSSYGQGQVIAFTEDPNYRAFTRGLEPLLGNAVFFGPTMVR